MTATVQRTVVRRRRVQQENASIANRVREKTMGGGEGIVQRCLSHRIEFDGTAQGTSAAYGVITNGHAQRLASVARCCRDSLFHAPHGQQH